MQDKDNIINIAKLAFYGGKYSDLLTEEYPNGCTLKEAIIYFKKHKDEFIALGIIKL